MTKSEIVLLIVVLIVYQAYATVLVMKSDHFDDTQKVRQVIFIWLIPFLGAVLVRIALNAAERAPRADAADPAAPASKDPAP